ncbi:MAG: hypothetical protein ACOX6L_07240 [Syntrophomonadaceae bacterium]|jgi:hypothetical protein
MKGHIAFCPHFHQPHFQLYRTREEAFRNSYIPWLRLLNEAVGLNDFFINLHFSGPFLYWMQDQKPEYINQLKELGSSANIGFIGGLADESFIQLSSRNDDYLYQLAQYDALLSKLVGINAGQWQGIHLVERECGEMTLHRIIHAAGLLKAPPIVYLDAETFYESHFAYPGSEYDFCLKHFGFKDPFSKTTISHIPQEMLFFGLRDEIGGQEFFSFPVHSQFRYQLLKRHSFTLDDKVRIKPSHYYFYIKDALQRAYETIRNFGEDREPILIIFEDAEKFGQWSKDPDGDHEWLMEFFRLVDRDTDLRFTGLSDYLKQYGFLDTYPVSSSHSYPEWENWTAKRGIRGVTFGDERLRRIMCRLRDVEDRQDAFEKHLFTNPDIISPEYKYLQGLIERSMLESPERYLFIEEILKNRLPEIAHNYNLINRVRNLVYQEDPKWASRHPSYGSSPFYDMQGIAYLELTYRLLEKLNQQSGLETTPEIQVRDWDFDGKNEVLFTNSEQVLVIDCQGGCVSYHQVLNPQTDNYTDLIEDLLGSDVLSLKTYNSIYRHSCPLVFTEVDSDISPRFYPEGGRRETGRNSLRCNLYMVNDEQEITVGEFSSRDYNLDTVEKTEDGFIAMLSAKADLHLLNSNIIPVEISKTISVKESFMTVTFHAKLPLEFNHLELVLAPELVCSASASDEVNFRPRAYVGIKTRPDKSAIIPIRILDISTQQENGYVFINQEYQTAKPLELNYVYQLCNADGSSFSNLISYSLVEADNLHSIVIEPAVKYYYRDYVFEGQSRLGYHTSGVLISPRVKLIDGEASIQVKINWDFETSKQESDYDLAVHLITGN